jgi:membrane-associated protein
VLNPLAGTIGIPIRTFTLWQVTGGLVWSLGVTLAGYALGSQIPGIDRYLLPIVAAVVAVSLLPILVEARARRREPATSTQEGPQ